MSGSEVSLDYTIISKEKYTLHEGTIDSIYQKNTKGFFVEVNGKFSFEIRLKNKAIVKLIEVKVNIGEHLQFELIGEKNVVIQTIRQKIDKQSSTFLVLFPESRERRLVTQRIKIEISNNETKSLSVVGLAYMLVRGEKVAEEKPNKNISLKPKQGFFEDAKMSPHRVPVSVRAKEAAIFQERKKNRDPKTQKIEAELNANDEQYELQRALELSKKEAKGRQEPKAKETIKEESISYYAKPREYSKLDYEKYKKIFQYVTPMWLQAQRRIQAEKGVKESERLSNAIQVRHFHNKLICIDVAPAAKKAELQKLCEQMGAKIKSQLCDHCILISTRSDTDKVSKIKKFKNVRVLKPNFISDCKSAQAYLDERDYFLKI